MGDRSSSEQSNGKGNSLTSGVPLVRTGLAGILMGLANLVPGVSGGTMVLVMGLYDRFVGSVADLTRLKFTRRSIVFVAVLGVVAALTIGLFSGLMSQLVSNHRTAMYSLFIGMTLGGAPLLAKMIRPVKAPALVGVCAGLALMIVIASTAQPRPPKTDGEGKGVAISTDYGRDVIAGTLGMSAMVLPGVSGAYMLLIMGRYEIILEAVHQAAKFVLTIGREGDLMAALPVVIPVGIGAILSLVGLSNLLKWLLRRHEKPTLGFLLGILLGSVIGIWPFSGETTSTATVLVGVGLAAAGFGATLLLSRIKT